MKDTLIKIGLSPEEVELYLSLLESGAQSAAQLASNTSVKRTYVYRITSSLANKGLVTEAKRGRATVFEPNSPDHLLSLAEAKKVEAEQAQASLEGVLRSLKQKYKSIDEKPLISSFLGISGLKKIYKDILDEKEDIILFRSVYDDKRPDLDKTILNHIANQTKAGIHVRTITPLEDATKETFLKHDKERLVKRHIIHKTKFELPAQIIVYNQKVALISLKSEVVATLIDNKEISDTFRSLFEFMWDKTKKEHEEIISTWKAS